MNDKPKWFVKILKPNVPMIQLGNLRELPFAMRFQRKPGDEDVELERKWGRQQQVEFFSPFDCRELTSRNGILLVHLLTYEK